MGLTSSFLLFSSLFLFFLSLLVLITMTALFLLGGDSTHSVGVDIVEF